MIRILSIDSPGLGGVAWWRNVRPLTELQRKWPDIQVRFVGEGASVHEIMSCDMVIMYRPVTDESLQFIKNCKVLGKKVIVDLDDNLWRLPEGHPSEADYKYYARQLNEIYAHADGVWCSTDPLMDFADARDGRGVVVPNAVLESDLPDRPSPYKGIVCWRGGIEQFNDITSPEAIEQFRANRERFKHWFFWGWQPAQMRGDNVRLMRRVEVVKYIFGLRDNGINLLWKPLQESQFNDAKSNIAFLEATLAGGVCVTNYAPGKPGWEWAVDSFTDNPDFIASQWKASRDAVVEHYNLDKINAIRYHHILRVLGLEGKTVSA